MIDNANLEQSSAPKSSVSYVDNAANDDPATVLVIGNGPVGIRFTQELLKRQAGISVTLFGNERVQPYNRVQLSALLAGEITREEIFTDLPSRQIYSGFNHIISEVKYINCEHKYIVDANNEKYFYQKLVIATGARPHIPNIPGIDQHGVYTFRNIKDADSLYARLSRARHIVVVGGGLLGIEASKALLKFNTKITLVQQAPRLMNKQLDFDAARVLQNSVASLGIDIITESGVRSIHGEGRVTGITTRAGETIICDTVLICAGIKPNMELAREAKIKVGRGIVVDDQLLTSDPDIFAIGECCEHRGLTYGLVNPGFEQAAIAAEMITRGNSQYLGSLEVSRLKVLGHSVCSMGEVTDLENRPRQMEIKYQSRKKNTYRKLVLNKGRLIGAVAIGEWQETRRIQEAYQNRRRIWPWQQMWFLLTGNVWNGKSDNAIAQWPGTTVICQCNNITQGELTQQISVGNNTLEALKKCTGAGTVCGSCRPLLAQLVGDSSPGSHEAGWLPVLIASVLAVGIGLTIALIPDLSVSESVQDTSILEQVWNNKTWKQITGFSLLGLTLIGLLMSLRKRVQTIQFGRFSSWRVLHAVLGVMSGLILMLHTGLHLGSNLNQFLMINFLTVLVIGAAAGITISLNHKISKNGALTLRKFWNWAHIVVTWPLPVLLGLHILTVYYF